ncbi:fatty acid synthase-like [Pseudomyrmex gracilis]|uniref:fatty acid synthase-like n=1 Tax=Pseudomyrmex gracilis TaxID=219809 RepID=UPI0009957434|nr:fatty acid synthase-like [Pseudomyrmex gracilis]
MMLEHSYEALIDAGINPKILRRKNTAIIVAVTYFEAQKILLYRDIQVHGKNLTGCAKNIAANLISHWLDVKEPSVVIDAACSSGVHAIAVGQSYIKSGQCEDALILGTNLCLTYPMTLQFARLGVLSPTGRCRPFDRKANGYCRSETIAAIYLQKAKHAKRNYATCKHIKLNSDGYKDEGITFPSKYAQKVLLTEFYAECGNMSAKDLDYIEAHGTGTIAGDPQEIDAICNALCKDKKSSLLIGSVKSNLGHSESSSTFKRMLNLPVLSLLLLSQLTLQPLIEIKNASPE